MKPKVRLHIGTFEVETDTLTPTEPQPQAPGGLETSVLRDGSPGSFPVAYTTPCLLPAGKALVPQVWQSGLMSSVTQRKIP